MTLCDLHDRLICPAVLLVVAGFLGCDRVPVVLTLVAAMAFQGMAWASLSVNPLDLSATHAAMLFGITNSTGVLAIIAMPQVIAELAAFRHARTHAPGRCSWGHEFSRESFGNGSCVLIELEVLMAFVQSILLWNLIRSLSANSHTHYYLVFHHPLTLPFQAQNLPFLQILPTAALPLFLLLKYSLRGFPGLFTVISEHICFLLLVFFLFLYFLVVGLRAED